jgi:outer membrane usher protein FimD/PapC
MMKKLQLIILTAIFLPSIAFSQGEYLEKGQNGVGISAGFSTNKDANAFGAGVGYSFSGIFDIGFSYTRATSDDEPEISANNILPSVSIHLLKQNENLPISISFSAGYVKGFYSSEFLDEYDLDMSSSGFIVGGSIFGKMKINPNFSIMPSFGISYYSLTLKLEDQYGDYIDEDDSTTNINLGLPLLFDMNNNLLVISPGVSINDDYNTFVVDLSFVFPN